MKSKRLLSAMLASLGAFSSLMATGRNDGIVKNKRGGGEGFINKNVSTRGKSQKIKNSKSVVSESGQKARPGRKSSSNNRSSDAGNRRQKQRSNSVDNKKQYVNFVDKNLGNNNSTRKRSWSTSEKVVTGVGSTVLLGGAATGTYLLANRAPCELLKNMDVSDLVLNEYNENEDAGPYCIKVKYKKEKGTTYYHCYKFFLVFEYEKDKKEMEGNERNNCYVALRVVDGTKEGSNISSEVVTFAESPMNFRYPSWEDIIKGKRENERNAIKKALDFVFDEIIKNEIQHMKDKNNNELYKTENKKKLKDLMVKMVGNNFGERYKKSVEYFDFTKLSIEEMKKLKEGTGQFTLEPVGNIGDCSDNERNYLCDGEIDSDGEDD